MTLPSTVHFENLGRRAYQKIGFRAPKKGEYYLSGAIVVAYQAPNNFSHPYLVVRPINADHNPRLHDTHLA